MLFLHLTDQLAPAAALLASPLFGINQYFLLLLKLVFALCHLEKYIARLRESQRCFVVLMTVK
jgi:hypothetical protein